MPIACPSCSTPSSPGSGISRARDSGEDRSSQVSPPPHSQSHLLSGECHAVRDILEECEPMDDQGLATFFRKVVARNMEINTEEAS